MAEIFVNYRTADQAVGAATIARELSDRFGASRVFIAHRSIPPGRDFASALIRGVRGAEVVLAVIGPHWLDDEHRAALDDEADWIRRELLEAVDSGIPVIPVLLNRLRLSRHELPPVLAWLADKQDIRVEARDIEHGLDALGNRLVELVPSLAAVDSHAKAAEPKPSPASGTTTVIGFAGGPVHSGQGDQFNGDGYRFDPRGSGR